jgi:alpha-tubulin suppressor-like RCC1 family protein
MNFLNGAMLAKYQADSVGHFLEKTSSDQILALNKATKLIRLSLQEGFADVANGLEAVTEQQVRTNSLLEGINQRMEMLIEEQRISNVLQENIAELLRIPDSQKQRQFHIEMGLKFFKNASKDADLYQDSLKDLLAAEALLPADYFVLRQIGMLYLYAAPLVNLEKAANYLTRAGKYASVESHPDAVRLCNVVSKSVKTAFSSQSAPSSNEIGAFAAETYRHGAAAHYALGNLGEAVRLIEKSARLDGCSYAIRFFKAKYLAAAGNEPEALSTLRTLPSDEATMEAVAADLDLAKEVASIWLPEAAAARQKAEAEAKSEEEAKAKARAEKEASAKAEAKRIVALATQKRLELFAPAMRRVGYADEQINKLLIEGGTILTWGSNACGQSSVPAALSGVVAIAAGSLHSVVLKHDGTVVAWGNNENRQIIVPDGLCGVVAIAAGSDHSVALKHDGTVVAWGGYKSPKIRVPVALNSDGTVKSWGEGGAATVPVGLNAVVAIAANGDRNVALRHDGTVVVWGGLGLGDGVPKGLSNVISIAAGNHHTVALKHDGTVVAWGPALHCGNGRSEEPKVPVGLSNVLALAAGADITFALKADGTFWVWGVHAEPDSILAGQSGVIGIAKGDWLRQMLALKRDGTLVVRDCFDRSDDEDDEENEGSGVVEVPANLCGVVAIAAGARHGLLLQIPPFSHKRGRFVTRDDYYEDRVVAEEVEADKTEKDKAAKAKIRKLIELAETEVKTESKKYFWQKKDFARARLLYQEAAELGSKEADEKIRALPS